MRLPSEQTLEEMILADPAILSRDWMIVGHQVTTPHGGRVDVLAIAPDGSLVVVELKRDRTPRDIVAQAVDYASWVQGLGPDDISRIYSRFSNGEGLGQAFRAKFGAELDETTLNGSHQIVIVASELDDSTERIVQYLNEHIPINVLFFQVFQSGKDQLLSRAWLIDPARTPENVAACGSGTREQEPWNGEYYVSFGPPESRDWQDARTYGFISAGGGNFYSQTLKFLSPGDRIWVNVPKTGYVGVGRVVEGVADGKEFVVETSRGPAPVLDVLKFSARYRERADDPEMAERFVRVRWLDTVEVGRAVREVGFFGNQNTVCRPKTPSWRETVERLKTRFTKWDG